MFKFKIRQVVKITLLQEVSSAMVIKRITDPGHGGNIYTVRWRTNKTTVIDKDFAEQELESFDRPLVSMPVKCGTKYPAAATGSKKHKQNTIPV